MLRETRTFTHKSNKMRKILKHSPSKLAALYAIELLHNKDEKKALQRYEELQRRKDMYYLPSETAMALSIADQILQGCNKRL